jgi:hypothetical protein
MNRIVLVVFLSVVSLSVLADANKDAKKTEAWRQKMNELSSALAETIPYLYPDPSMDQKKLTAKVKRLQQLTKDFDLTAKHAMTMPDEDPVLPYIASMFRQEIERAYVSLQDGHAEYGKAVLRSSVSYCITCHTRANIGTQFPLLKAFEKPLERASWIEKLEFQTASRQYDTVLSEVMGQLKNPGTVGISALDLERGARTALSILVRLKKDPDRAALLAQAMGKSPSATVSMKEAARVWMKDIRTWQDQRNKTFSDGPAKLAEARKLSGGDESLSEHSEVRHLRASLLMHEYLQAGASGPAAAEALYLIGRSYNQLGEIGMWSLHEFYYVACIDKAPHTTIAESCYRAYADTITLGFSGSGGVRVPKTVNDHLARLKAKAQVKAGTEVR